jgi:hypothetical protein
VSLGTDLELAARLIVLNDARGGSHAIHARLQPMACKILAMGENAPVKLLCACGKRLKFSRTHAAGRMAAARQRLIELSAAAGRPIMTLTLEQLQDLVNSSSLIMAPPPAPPDRGKWPGSVR